ncbi:MAG: general stress protein [Planctomycetota bacterium]|nr:MAG: general stress protein [Planctomycetota bacterium]REJ95375.1 MAG: general stress protein [Planctomycetota bacterium]
MTDTKDQQAIDQLPDLIRDLPVAMLVTCTPQGTLRGRPMVNINTHFQGDLWFLTHEDDPKVAEVRENPQVNVSFASANDRRYVSVSGKASVVQDHNRVALLWTDACEKWFPGGRQDPKLALLHIEVEYAEYWDEQTGVMTELSGLVKQVFQGEAEEQSAVEHEKLDLQKTK